MNGLPFLSHLYASRLFTAIQSPHIDAFFTKQPVGFVHRDLIAWREGEAALEPIEIARTSVSQARLASLEQGLRAMLRPNYRWAQ